MLDQDTARALLTIADEHQRAGWRCWGTGTSCPRSAAAGCSTSPPAGPTPTPASPWTWCTASPARSPTADGPHAPSPTPTTPSSPSRCAPATTPARCSTPCSPAARSSCTRASPTCRRRSPTTAARLYAATASRSRSWSTPASRPPRSTRRSATGSSPPAGVDDTHADDHRRRAADRCRRPGRDPPQRPRPRRRQPRHLDRHRGRPARTGSPSPTHDDRRAAASCRADYVRRHVELAYATTAHGVQGDTVTAAHLVVGEHTGAASAYVGMTRGRTSNTAHLVAADVDDARAAVDRGVRPRPGRPRPRRTPPNSPGGKPSNYAVPRPLEQVLGELRGAWEREARSLERLARHEPRRDALRDIIALRRAPSRSSGRPPRTGTGTPGSSTPRPPNRFSAAPR